MNIERINEPINNFEEYGFTADFEGKILHTITEGGVTRHIGYIRLIHPILNWIKPVVWYSSGVLETKEFSPTYNLTPIVPEITYPIFKKNKNGDIFKFTDSENMICVLSSTLKSSGASFKTNTFSHDVWEDVPYDPVQGLYHGQPVWLHFLQDASMIYFYCGYGKFTTKGQQPDTLCSSITIEPISLDTLKTLPFIWKQYKAFIKEN